MLLSSQSPARRKAELDGYLFTKSPCCFDLPDGFQLSLFHHAYQQCAFSAQSFYLICFILSFGIAHFPPGFWLLDFPLDIFYIIGWLFSIPSAIKASSIWIFCRFVPMICMSYQPLHLPL
jgi:hypothetical protein